MDNTTTGTQEQALARKVADFRDALLARGIGGTLTDSTLVDQLVRDYFAALLKNALGLS